MDKDRLHFSDRHNVVRLSKTEIRHGIYGVFQMSGHQLAGIPRRGHFRGHNSAFRRTIDTGNAITRFVSWCAIWPVPQHRSRIRAFLGSLVNTKLSKIGNTTGEKFFPVFVVNPSEWVIEE